MLRKRTTHVLATLTLGLPLLVWGVSASSPVAAAPQAAPANHPEMPDGPGKDVTIATCTKCHSITNVTSQHKDKDGWTATITKMVGYGATGSDDDFEAILTYVTKNYGLDTTAAPTAPPADKSAPAPAPGN